MLTYITNNTEQNVGTWNMIHLRHTLLSNKKAIFTEFMIFSFIKKLYNTSKNWQNK